MLKIEEGSKHLISRRNPASPSGRARLRPPASEGEVNNGDGPTFLENYPSIILQLQATSNPTDA